MGIEFAVQIIVLVFLWMAAPRLSAVYSRRWSPDMFDLLITVIRFCVLLAGGLGVIGRFLPVWTTLLAVPWFRVLALVAGASVVAMRGLIARHLCNGISDRRRTEAVRASTMLAAGAIIGLSFHAFSSEWVQLTAVATSALLVWLFSLRSDTANAAKNAVLSGAGSYLLLVMLLTWSY